MKTKEEILDQVNFFITPEKKQQILVAMEEYATQCQEDMADKKYTEEDVIKAISLARKTIVNKWGANGEESIDFAHSNTKIMQSLNKQD